MKDKLWKQAKEMLWRHKTALSLGSILVAQVPFVALRLTTDGVALTIIEVLHLLLTSGLSVYLFSKAFETFLENRLIGASLRKHRKEVRVMYSDMPFKGMGEHYPRDPTLLIQPATFDMNSDRLILSFNNSYEGAPDEEKTGKWSDLQLMRVGEDDGFKLLRVGFPDPYIRRGVPMSREFTLHDMPH